MDRNRRHRLRDSRNHRVALFLAGMLFGLALMTPQIQAFARAIMSFSRAVAGS